jgi:intein/homing endonuclease/superfamily II DNA or RNA helicase
MVSGPGIEALKHAIYDMAHRGAPDQINDHGFNQIDFASYQSYERNGYLIANKEIPAVAVTRMLDSLFRYSKRQLPDIFNNDLRTSPYYKSIQVQSYQDLKDLVEIDFKKALQKKNPLQTIVQYDSKKVVVFDKQFDKFGKNKVYIPGGVGVNSSLSKLIKEIAVKKLEEEGAGLVRDNFTGKLVLPVYKKYQKIEGEIDFYAVHPTILNSIVELLKSNGYEVEFESGRKDLSVPENSPEPIVQNDSKKVMVFDEQEKHYGKFKTYITGGVDEYLDKEMEEIAVKKLKEEGAGLEYNKFNKKEELPVYKKYQIIAGKIDFYAFHPTILDSIVELLKSKGYEVEFESGRKDLSVLEKSPEEQEKEKQNAITFIENPEKVAEFIRIYNSKKPKYLSTVEPNKSVIIKIKYYDLSDQDKAFLKECVQYSFPNYTYNKEEYSYYVSGNFKQYISFGKILKKFGYNVDELRKIVKDKLKDDRLEETRWEGMHDNDEGFIDQIDKNLPDSNFDLYRAQKEGIAFLYGRDHAILGDETGLGKCIIDGYIQTNLGCFKIEDLWKKFSVNCIKNENEEEYANLNCDLFVHSMDEQEKITEGRVVSLFRQKINTWIKVIKTKNGKKIKSTIPHMFYTLDGWKKDIGVDDYVCSSKNQFSLQNNDFEDFELARFLGWQISEGWESSKRATVTITQKDRLVLEDLQKTSKVKSTIHANKNVFYLLINSKVYKKYLESLGYEWGHKSATKRIPEFIMQANDEIVKVFLQAYFDAECYVNTNCRQIEISSASETLIYQLSVLLQRFDIMCSFSEKYKSATNGKKIKRKYHYLYVCGTGVAAFFEKIGLSIDYKIKNYEGIKTKPNLNKEGKPVHLVLSSFFQKYDLPYRILNIPSKNYILGKRFATNDVIEKIIKGFISLKDGTVLSKYKKLKNSKWTKKTTDYLYAIEESDVNKVLDGLLKLRNNDLQYEKIKNVTYERYEGYVYDLCVAEHKNYIANNLICHNTAQLISAAALRMQKDSKPTLIITLKATQEQWVNEIVNVMGEDQRSDISIDPQNPKKWTVVYYENFSSGKQIENNMEKLKSAGFGIVIFDELHKIKHSSSKRSQNISKVVENIPTKWGASATISSNKPMDVRNQLVMTGHHLGKINEDKFKHDFAGENYEKESEENKIKSAENLNKWLNLSGLYVRRSKQDIREMPNLSIQNKVVSIDQSKFGDEFNSKISAYQKPELPISRLIAARETIAKLKTDQTSNKVLDIVKENINRPPAASKIVVFTNFVESANQLVEKIDSGLKSINRKFYVLTYLSSTKKADRLTTKENFTEDSNAKVLVMSMKMGGTGIDFPNAAQNMVINDFDWTPESAEQSEGRIYRINTNHPVNIDYVVADGIDKTIYDKVQKKRELAEIIQKYRKEYHEKDDAEALKIIVKAQRDMAKIDDDMVKAINNEIPGAGEGLKESFKSYIDRYEQFKDLLLYGISLEL